jgi:hypothetical protein
MSWRYHKHERNQQRRDEKQFEVAPTDLIGTPHVFNSIGASASTTTNFQMPANGYLSFSHSVAIGAGDITVEAVGGNRAFTSPALGANIVNAIEHWFEEGETIRITRNGSAIAGNFSLKLIDDIGRDFEIATCVFT